MRTLLAVAVGTVPLLTTRVASAQSRYMMNGDMWGSGWMGGYGGAWLPILLVSVVAAAAAGDLSEPQARYQQERAICMNGQSHQDRATCLREADAALAESKRGDLSGGPDRYEQNQLMRCEFHPAEDREYCLRRMRGEGTTSGSVESGGIYRELRTTVPAK